MPDPVEKEVSIEEFEKQQKEDNRKRIERAAREGFYGTPICCPHCSGNHHGDTCPNHGWVKKTPPSTLSENDDVA